MKRYGLLGHPLTHSFSADYFAEKFGREGLDACYQNFDLPAIEQFPALLQQLPDLAGMNVTIPYKQAVIPYLDALDPEAAAIGAVNVIHVARRGVHGLFLTGYNSDLIGFRESLRPLLDQLRARMEAEEVDGQPLQALVFGTGGASKAVCYGLQQLGLPYQTVSRTATSTSLAYADLTHDLYNRYRLLVNTTPLGMFPNTEACPPLDYDRLTAAHVLYDVVYTPAVTRFLAEGERRGALVKNGLDMLHGQAEAAWTIWNR